LRGGPEEPVGQAVHQHLPQEPEQQQVRLSSAAAAAQLASGVLQTHRGHKLLICVLKLR
jgi:hypothetical protein